MTRQPALGSFEEPGGLADQSQLPSSNLLSTSRRCTESHIDENCGCLAWVLLCVSALYGCELGMESDLRDEFCGFVFVSQAKFAEPIPCAPSKLSDISDAHADEVTASMCFAVLFALVLYLMTSNSLV